MAEPITVTHLGRGSHSVIFLEKWEIPIARRLGWKLRSYKGDFYHLCSSDRKLDRCMQAFHREKFRFAVCRNDFSGAWMVVGLHTDLADAALDRVLRERDISGEGRYTLSYCTAKAVARLATILIHQSHGPYSYCEC